MQQHFFSFCVLTAAGAEKDGPVSIAAPLTRQGSHCVTLSSVPPSCFKRVSQSPWNESTYSHLERTDWHGWPLRVLHKKPAASSLETQARLAAASKPGEPVLAPALAEKWSGSSDSGVQRNGYWGPHGFNGCKQGETVHSAKLFCCLWAHISQKRWVTGLGMFFSAQVLWLYLMCISTNLITAC